MSPFYFYDAAKTPNAIEYNLASSESEREVNTIGAFVPMIKPAFFASAKKVSDLYSTSY